MKFVGRLGVLVVDATLGEGFIMGTCNGVLFPRDSTRKKYSEIDFSNDVIYLEKVKVEIEG